MLRLLVIAVLVLGVVTMLLSAAAEPAPEDVPTAYAVTALLRLARVPRRRFGAS